MGIPENITRLRELHGLTQDELGIIAGVTGKAVWTWEAGRATPRMKQFQKIADYFGYPKTVLIDDDGIDRIDPVTKRVRRPESARTAVASSTTAPLYGRISAGVPIESMPIDDYLGVPDDIIAAHPRAFYLRVDGESMNRVLPHGSYALVDPEAEVTDNDMVAVNVNGYDATVKRITRRKTVTILSPDSYDESFTDMIFDYSSPGTDTVTLIGRVVWYRPPHGERL